MRYVIVNADDLGLSPGVNRGVIEAYESGVVTSASLLVDRPASAAAARAAGHAAGLAVGLHVDLADLDGRPLVDLTDPSACRAQVVRQVERFAQLVGRPPTHLDSHRNVHRRPAALAAFQQVAAAHGLPLREHTAATYVSRFYGQWDGGIHPEQVSADGLIRLLSGLGPGWWEVGCHPGYVDADLRSSYRSERRLELAALTDPRVGEAVAALGITLLGFPDLPAATVAAGQGRS